MSASKKALLSSPSLAEYMRTGTIYPLRKPHSKEQVESVLGRPTSWAGQGPSIGWTGPFLEDPYDSWAWGYDSLCVGFPHAEYPDSLPGIHLYFYALGGETVSFPSPFTDIPIQSFTVSDLARFLRFNRIDYIETLVMGGPQIISEGGIGVGTLHGSTSWHAEVICLYPELFDRSRAVD